MSLMFATQLSAVATAALAAFAVVTAVFAFLAYRKQTQEVGILLKQSEREAGERRRAQAAQVFIGIMRDQVRLVRPFARNASGQPIYDAQLWYSRPDGKLSGPDDLGVLMPGDAVSGSREFSARDALANTWLTFQDAAGVRWKRDPTGILSEHESGALTVMQADSIPVNSPG